MARVHYRLFYHFVWATWDREPLLVEAIEQEAYALIQRACRQFGAGLIALGGIADHVHLLVSLPRTVLIPDLMETVKGMSSKALNDSHASPTWSFKWQGGYGVDTICPGHVPRVAEYIRCQKAHHAQGTLWPNCEPNG